MLVLAKAMLSLMAGFILAIICGLVLIPILKTKSKQSISIFLQNRHKEKEGTPTMGGLIFIIPTTLIVIGLLISNKIEYSSNLLLIMVVFLGYALIGFLDDYLIIKRKNNIGLTEIQKLIGQLIIAVLFFFIYMKSGNDTIVDIHTLNIAIDLKWFYGIFILFMLIASTNAVNITDGLDGLAGGLSMIAFLAMGLITWNSTWITGNTDIAIFCFILVGSLLGFLFFNTHPAKIFMGDMGSLSLGGTLASIAILTDHELTFIIIMGVFIIETLASLIQIFSVMVFRKKVFLMTPLHHHFEKLGFAETDVVKAFWVGGIILAMAGVLFAVWI